MAVAVCSVGVPLPAQTARKSGDPFPCQQCACGCKDAETCWRNCCCHTNREKLAWAKRHGVKPPAFVIAAARQEERCDEGRVRACCNSAKAMSTSIGGAAPACCANRKKDAAFTLACSASPQSGCARCASHHKKPRTTADHHSSSDFILLIAKLRCTGLTLSLSLLPPSVIAQPVDFAIEDPIQFAVPRSMAILYEEPFLAVPAPPPDALAA